MDRSMDDSRKVFDQMTDHNVMSWTAIITGYVQSGYYDMEAIKLYCRMIDANSLISLHAKSEIGWKKPEKCLSLLEKNLVSYNIIVDVDIQRILDSAEAFELFSQIDLKSGLMLSMLASLLSGAASVVQLERENRSMLGCGNIEAAFQVFEGMEDRNVISWTSIITGFAKHGFAHRAVELFSQMLGAGVKPNEVTYIAVLSA
ncbi:hypothetical protein HAX54_042499 [Datura stramonium]|uniref:Pentatricopeptide repeat-containing protein n=1 Tax=Datura stramonium TaxID=4076 RepID=A0ABS8W3A0_DATST|nr:hypothetical protein [Datura stramonium]